MQPVWLALAITLGQAAASPADSSAPLPERWLVMQTLQGTWPGWILDSNRVHISGWTEASFTASSAERSQLPMGFNYRANEFLLQQNWFRVERPVLTTGTTEPTFGFLFDAILPGSDYRFTLPRGILNSQLTANHGQPNLYGVDPVQFYTEAYFPTIGQGLDIKIGRFFALFGVEDIDAPRNLLMSHSYTFIYNPYTHTGVVATLKLSSAWSVQGGAVLGSDVFIDRASSPTAIGSIEWAPPDGRDSVLFSFILGSGRFNQPQNFNNPNICDLVYTHEFNPRFYYHLEGLAGCQSNVPDLGTVSWYSIANYLTYTFTPRLSGTTRLELFSDPQGQRTGFEGRYTALTTGVSFRPTKSIMFRPEIRYDYNDQTRPFENRHGVFTAGSDMILRW